MILDHGMRQMLERQEDVFHYVTVMNENYAQPSLPEGVAQDVIRVCTGIEPSAPERVATARCACWVPVPSC